MFKSLILVALAITAQFGASSSAKSPVTKINDYLVDKLPSNNDAGSNLEAANKWLQEVQSTSSDDGLIEALASFVALDGVRKNPACDSDTYLKVRQANKLTGHRSFDEREKSLTRVQSIARQVGHDVAKLCLTHYEAELENKLGALDKKLINRAVKLYKSSKIFIIADVVGEMRAVRAKRLQKHEFYGLVESIIEELHKDRDEDPELEALKTVDDERRGKKRVVDEVKVRQIMEKYVTEPCQYFNSKLETLLEMAKQGERFNESLPKKFGEFAQSPFQDYVPTLHLCRFLLYKGQDAVTKMASYVISKEGISPSRWEVFMGV